MKTTKGGKVMNPTDAYRKELRKKELKRNKKERKKVREFGILKKNPETLREQIDKLEMMKADGALDKARKHKKRQLEDTLNLVIKKQKEYEEKMREKGEAPVMFSHLGPPRKRTTAEEEERVKHPRPEDSVYFHPTLNPTGAPPPGKPPMYKSSIGPRIPLSASSSNAASSSKSDSEDMDMAVPPPPPLPPLPLTDAGDSSLAEDPTIPPSLPLPPPPPVPPKPLGDSGTQSQPPLPTPPVGPPSKDLSVHATLPPPPPPPRTSQPPPPGTSGIEREKGQPTVSEGVSLKELDQASDALPPLPPPLPGLPPKLVKQSTGPTISDTNTATGIKDTPKMMPPPPPPPPPRPPVSVQRPPPVVATLQNDVLPPGISRFPPPPPDLRPPSLPLPGLPPNRPMPPGMVAPPLPRPPFGPPPGPPPMSRPPLPPGHPPLPEDDLGYSRPLAPMKPSFVKSAASTVVKRPLAQHTPELTAMIPASVRVRRETAVQKAKLKPQLAAVTTAPRPSPSLTTVRKAESAGQPSAPKLQSIDDSYMAFLEDMKALGALEK